MIRPPLLAFAAIVAIGATLLGLDGALAIPRWLLWVVTVLAALLAAHELLGRPLPFLRWSFLRMMLGMRTLDAGTGRSATAARRRWRST